MIFEKHSKSEKYEIHFRLETNEMGQLISQEQTVKNLKFDFIQNYSFRRPEKIHFDEVLYHMTRKENILDIEKYGLTPIVGNCYANHWLAAVSDDIFDDIYENLYPGIFFLSGQRVSHGRAAGYKTIKININDLEPEYLFVDDAWKNEKSFFYTKEILPEKLFITR